METMLLYALAAIVFAAVPLVLLFVWALARAASLEAVRPRREASRSLYRAAGQRVPSARARAG